MIDYNDAIEKAIKFAFVGFIGTILNLAILFSFTEFAHTYYIISEVIAIAIVYAINFLGNVLVGNIELKEIEEK